MINQITSNSKPRTDRKHTKKNKTEKPSFSKEKVENTDLNKPVLNKIMTTHK